MRAGDTTASAPNHVVTPGPWRPAKPLCAAFALLALPGYVRAQEVELPAKGHGSFSVDYLQVQVDQRTDQKGDRENLGKVEYRTLRLGLDYAFADRWAASVSLPFGSNRASGTDHDPRIFSDPHGQRFIDDGDFHAGWKDWSLGVRYQWLTGPVRVTPYLSYRFPSHDYQYYGESALGLQQSELQFGVSAGGVLPGRWRNAYVTGNASYSYMEKRGSARVNHSTLQLDLGYFVTPRLSAHAGLTHRQSYGGLDFPGALFDSNGALIEDVLFHHDTIRNISFTEGHVGLSLQLGPRYTLNADVGRTLRGENANLIRSALNLGISRSF
jgi:hypothetical protein